MSEATVIASAAAEPKSQISSGSQLSSIRQEAVPERRYPQNEDIIHLGLLKLLYDLSGTNGGFTASTPMIPRWVFRN